MLWPLVRIGSPIPPSASQPALVSVDAPPGGAPAPTAVRAARAALRGGSPRGRTDRLLAPGLLALLGSVGFVLLRLWVAADGDISRFAWAGPPFTNAAGAPPGLYVFHTSGYDGQFYYRIALDPANLHRTAFGITVDTPYRFQRIGYPLLAWLLSAGRHSWVAVTLVAVNVLAIAGIGLVGGVFARQAGRHALCGLLPAGYFGLVSSLSRDLTEPVAALCLLGGVLAYRRKHPVLAGLLLAYGALTRETVMVVALAIGLTRLAGLIRGRVRPGRPDLAWCLPAVAFAGWQVVLRAATGSFTLGGAAGSNTRPGLPLAAFVDAVQTNLQHVSARHFGPPDTWFLEVATLAAVVIAAAISLRSTTVPACERLAFAGYVLELAVLAPTIWDGFADLRSVDEVYLFAVLILFGSPRRRLRALAACAALALCVVAAHHVLFP